MDPSIADTLISMLVIFLALFCVLALALMIYTTFLEDTLEKHLCKKREKKIQEQKLALAISAMKSELWRVCHKIEREKRG